MTIAFEASPSHASAGEYRDFLTQQGVRAQKGHLLTRRAFVAAYPMLTTWLTAPLVERVRELKSGWEGQACSRPRLQPYLHFLVRRGSLVLDWPWLIASGDKIFRVIVVPPSVQAAIDRLTATASTLGYNGGRDDVVRRWVKLLHLAGVDIGSSFDGPIAEVRAAIRDFGARPDRTSFFADEAWRRWSINARAQLHSLATIAYHKGAMAELPRIIRVERRSRFTVPGDMATLIDRYAVIRQQLDAAPETCASYRSHLRHFSDWVSKQWPEVDSFALVTRDHVLAYAATLNGTPESRIGRLSRLNVFFRDTTSWAWPGAPTRPLIGHRDLPHRSARIPRYIPADQLAQVMRAIRELECPLQRAALLTARWSGARRGELRWLEHDCLDTYPDGTSRLRIFAGKTRSERLVPLHEEAADALRVVQRLAPVGTSIADRFGHSAPRLFVRAGHVVGCGYLFETPLARVSERLALDGMTVMPITAHRFRHTVGTEMAEGGARLHTIMKMLGHTSTGMTLVYAHISDVALREDYQKVLGPGAQVAGSLAEKIRAGAMPQSSIDWLKLNFFKTELELGHCLRLPEEGPCECDLYLNCAKFVTTPAYAPRLRERRAKEALLVADARDRGFAREVERHSCTIRRIDELLAEIGGEPVARQLQVLG